MDPVLDLIHIQNSGRPGVEPVTLIITIIIIIIIMIIVIIIIKIASMEESRSAFKILTGKPKERYL